jgi:hypothetical protein
MNWIKSFFRKRTKLVDIDTSKELLLEFIECKNPFDRYGVLHYTGCKYTQEELRFIYKEVVRICSNTISELPSFDKFCQRADFWIEDDVLLYGELLKRRSGRFS